MVKKAEKKPVSAAPAAVTAIKKKFAGVVVSDKMDKTIVVRVDRIVLHPKYNKRVTVSRRYKVHDEKESFVPGDKVSFVECRPLSADKRWRVIYSK
jgi:small subunit ribosomal protein S17